jgi:flagellar basal-body rod protein FlgC
VISQNIANAHTTHDVNGQPYQRQVVVFESALQNAMNGEGDNPPPIQAKIERDTRPPLQLYDPGNPEADAHGMVSMPNVNIHEEMADMISASRTYEANLAAVKNARSMAMQTLAIGRH